MKHISHWIGGKSRPGTSGRTGDIYDPATGQVTGTVDFASAAEVDEAVSAAAEAAAGWRNASLARRAGVMFGFRELIRSRADDLAALISSSTARCSATRPASWPGAWRSSSSPAGSRTCSRVRTRRTCLTRVDSYSIRQPLGVAAGITPFNFPAMVPMWMFPLAIACGNAFILKPSEKDPSASVLLAELLAEAGLPDGVFSVVHGDAVAVNALLTHPGIAAVSFVGSTPIAKHVYETAAAAGKRVQALGGAKNHMVVLGDADLDNAADAAVSAGFGSAGERCMAVSVVVAVDQVADRSSARSRSGWPRCGSGRPATRTRRWDRWSPARTGTGWPATSTPACATARCSPWTAGSTRSAATPGGFWLGPSVLDHVTPQMSCYTDEIFGPVLSVVRVPSPAAALDLVNANPYGNGVAVFTTAGGAARQFVNEVTVGMVGVNVPIPVPMAYYSFGGWKSSLFGDTHMHGTEGVHFYTRGKAVTSRWPEPGPGSVSLKFPVSN